MQNDVGQRHAFLLAVTRGVDKVQPRRLAPDRNAGNVRRQEFS
jgi:hypothetical protein